jgi:hypothetical protein
MTSRKKGIILAASVVVLVVGSELAVRRWSSSASCVQIVNEGDEPMDDLVLSYSGTTLRPGLLAAGESTQAWFSPSGPGLLRLGFTQKGNGLKGFELPDFDPSKNHRSGSMLVLVVKTNQVERFVETDDRLSSPKGLFDRVLEMLFDAFREPR